MGKLSKNVIIYFIGNTINRFMGIIVLLIATHILTNNEDIGHFTFISNTTNIVLTIFCLQIWMSIIRYVFDYSQIKQKLKVISTGYFIGFFSFLIYIITLIIFCIIKKYDVIFFFQIFFLSFSYVFNQLVQFACRGLGKNKLYVFSGVFGSFMQLITSVLFLFVFRLKSSALILATAFSYIGQGFFIELFLQSLKRFKFKYISFRIMKKMIRYSIPTTMNSIAYNFNQSAYTWVLAFFYNNAAIGLFTPAYRMMSLINLFVMSFNFAFQEYSFFIYKSKVKSKIYSKTFNYFLRFISSGTVLLLPATSVLFSLIIGQSYKEAKFLMPILYFSSIFDSAQIFLGSIMQSEKKVGYMFFSQFIGVITTISTMFIITNFVGLQSVGIAMTACFFIVTLIRSFVIKAKIKIYFNPKYLLHFIPAYILTTFIFLKYGAVVNFLYAVLLLFYFIFCNKHILISLILKFAKKNKNIRKISGEN